jgi:hypothetical protein
MDVDESSWNWKSKFHSVIIYFYYILYSYSSVVSFSLIEVSTIVSVIESSSTTSS